MNTTGEHTSRTSSRANADARTGRAWRVAFAAALLASCAPGTLRAETSNAELAAEIKALKEQIREMRGAISETRRETRKVRAVASRTPAPAYVPPPAFAAIPPGAVPAFVTADKKLQFGAITITPGGFIAAESVFRTRATQSDINTDWRSIPFGNNPLAHTNEFRFTARQSRVALLAEGAITPTFVAAGYMELDFLGAAPTANSNEANAFQPRIRNLYATLDNADYGMHVLAGQNWSLATLNSKGITPRNEVTPPSIDGQFVPGFVWARQPGIRLTKDFDRKLWFSLAAEESQTTFANACLPNALNLGGAGYPTGSFGNGNSYQGFGSNGAALNGGVTCAAAGTGGGFANTTNFSLDHVPDVIAKAAYEARIGDRDVHLETFGMYRDFYDRVSYFDNLGVAQNRNRDTTGYGVGGGLIIPVIPRRLDFQATGMYGRGIGRYGTSQLADTTTNSDGSLRPIQEGMALAGLTLHATPAIDLYAFGGIERSFRTYSQNFAGGVSQNSFYGLGAPGAVTANVQGCNLEPNAALQYNPIGACTSTAAGNTKQIFQLTAGMWDKIYKGAFGEVRVGLQYQYTERQVFNNVPGVNVGGVLVGTNNYQPKANDQAILTSMRYYPFQ